MPWLVLRGACDKVCTPPPAYNPAKVIRGKYVARVVWKHVFHLYISKYYLVYITSDTIREGASNSGTLEDHAFCSTFCAIFFVFRGAGILSRSIVCSTAVHEALLVNPQLPGFCERLGSLYLWYEYYFGRPMAHCTKRDKTSLYY